MAVAIVTGGCTAARVTQPSVDEQIARVTPGLKLTFEAAPTDERAPYGMRRFSYGLAQPGWPYGEGFAVFSHSTETVLWVYLHHGDFPPHEIRWADFDGDRRLDMFFHAGFEDIATTYVYVNRVAADTFGVSQFAIGYENTDVYAVVLDFDGDDRPELLVPEPYGEDDACASEFHEFEVSRTDVRNEYRRLASRFDDFNFKFGQPPDEYAGLSLFEKVYVQGVGHSAESEHLREHLLWRLGILRGASKQISAGCRDRVWQTISYLEAMLK